MMNPTMVRGGGFGGMTSPAQSHNMMGHGGYPMDRNTPMTPGGGGGIGVQPVTPSRSMQMVPAQHPGGTLSLGLLIDFICQRVYHELSILAELLPRKTDMERKQEIFNFAARNRLLAVRLLGLVKWASSAAKVDKSMHIMSFLEKQSLLFVDSADCLSRIARDTLVHARLPNFHIPAAVEVLTTGTYSRLPNCIRERIVPPEPITPAERRATLLKLNQVIQHRLVTIEIPSQMRNMRIENGRVIFKVENEFSVSVTLLGDCPTIPWKIIEIEIEVDDKEIGDGMSLVHTLQIEYVQQMCQARIDASPTPLKDLYDILHSFAQSLQLDVLYSQVLKLCRERLGDSLSIEEYTMGKSLVLAYWKELSNFDTRADLPRLTLLQAELGYKITIYADPNDPSQPLSIRHQPPLSPEETEQTAEGVRSNQLEKILVRTIYLRSKNRLSDLKKEIELNLGIECSLQGSPSILSVTILSPCLRSEQLLVSVNIHVGSFLVHVPQFESPPVIEDIQQLLNSPSPDYSVKLKALISQLRYWITERRCEKTLSHLPASASERIMLLKWDEHPILSKIGPHRLTIQFQKHPYAILIVEFEEREEYPTEMEYNFYLVMVKKAGADENEELINSATSPSSPKFYLKPITILPLDTYACTHGPSTEIDAEAADRVLGKRRLRRKVVIQPEKKQKNPAYFVPELAHIVSMCDERLPFALMLNEFNDKGIINGGATVEANGTCLCVPIMQFPFNLDSSISHGTLEKLHERLESATLRSQMQLKGFRTWNLELKFTPYYGRMLIPSAEKPVHFVYEMTLALVDHIPKVVENILQEWRGISKLFDLLERSNWLMVLQMNGLVEIRSFTWNKLVIAYGPNRAELLSLLYNTNDRCYRLSFGGAISHNPHSIMRTQLEHYLNTGIQNQTQGVFFRGILDSLLRLLNDTYEPFFALSKLPTTPQLGAMTNRPSIPVQTFVLLPCSPSHIRIVYLNVYCLDIHFQTDGIVSIRDGAYSMFDKTQVLGELTPTQGLKAFLSKYVDESAVFRRRSQSEDDNPPSPITTLLDNFDSVGTPGGSGGSSAATPSGGFLSVKPQSPAPGPPRSNPHTPASPHTHTVPHSSSTTGFSPATSFANLASPPSIPHLSQQSPNPSSAPGPLHHPSPSPSSHIPAPSPSGGPLSVPTPSPNPLSVGSSSHQQQSSVPTSSGPVGHPSPFFHPPDTSPAAVHSPWAAGSPLPRPSPMRIGQSPTSSHTLSSQQSISSRVLPQRSWAGAIPTILTHEALEILCSPSTNIGGQPPPTLGHYKVFPCSPLERFLGCSYLRRQLQRIVQTEENLNLNSSSEPGVILFRSETMQFRVSIEPNHFQSLQIKINPAPEFKDLWSPEEIQLLENFFASFVVSPPFRPNGLAAFAKMVSLPVRIIRDCIQIIRIQMFPHLGEQQGWKWGVQLCLTVPPSAIPIIPPGMPAIVTSTSKILIYLHITKVKSQQQQQGTPGGNNGTEEMDTDSDKVPFLVIPLIHEMATNVTQLAEKRAMGPPSPDYLAVTQQLKRYTEYSQMNNIADCSIFPSVQDLLTNLNLDIPIHPPGPPQHLQQMVVGVPPMVRPQGQMMYPGNQPPNRDY